MDKDSLLSAAFGAAPLICAAVGVVAGLAAFCIRPAEGPLIKDVVVDFVGICGTAWQATRSQKQPGS